MCNKNNTKGGEGHEIRCVLQSGWDIHYIERGSVDVIPDFVCFDGRG